MALETQMQLENNILDGKYQLGDLLGQGAHGSVYRARHLAMNRDVAIKIVRPRVDASAPAGAGRDSMIVRRFEQEAQIISQLTALTTVHVHDYGTDGEVFYLVLEFVDGQTLSGLLREQGRLPIRRAVEFAIQMLDGLEEAHQRGVLHRDLKPANIMITRDFRGRDLVKVLDFGVAKIMADVGAIDTPKIEGLEPHDETLTQENAFVGTPRYAAPEQFNSQPVSPATDLWAVGAILWEMLLGQPLNPSRELFDCITFHVRQGNKAHLPPADANLPAPLVDILAMALHPEGPRRWRDAASMRHALESCKASLPDARVDGDPPTSPWPNRQPDSGQDVGIDNQTTEDFVPNTLEQEPGFKHLLQGKDAWWHFMAAKAQGALTPELDGDEIELELQDVGRIAQRKHIDATAKFQPHHTSSLRCDRCGAEIPGDLTFCVHCATAPKFRASSRGQLLVIDAIEDEDILREVAHLLGSSNDALVPTEIEHALRQPPGVFFFPAVDEHAQVLVDRLGELGVRARLSHEESGDVSMLREVFESFARSNRAIDTFLAALCFWTALAFFIKVPAAIIGILATTFALVFYQRKQFARRYELDVEKLLNSMTGMTPDIKQRAIKGLTSLRDDGVKQLLTLCLIEYYAIWRQLSAAPPSMRPLLGGLRENLQELINQILDACLRFGELHGYLQLHDLSALEKEIEDLDQQLLTTQDPTTREMMHRRLNQRHKQVLSAQEVRAALPGFKERLRAMCASLETLRARVVSMTLAQTSSDADEALVQQVILELDDEMHVFEQTLAEVQINRS